MVRKFEVVPTIKSLHYGFYDIFLIKTSKTCIMELLKSGPVATYYANLSILSIIIRESLDL
jgi:hypothetical protein